MKDALTTPRIAGAILAGGHASRMGGIAKGAIRADGDLSLVERLVVHILRCGIEQIIIVANDSRPYARIGCPFIPDKRRDAGPLAGIEAALAHFADQCDAVLCLPCDLPALSSKEISSLLSAFAAGGGPVTFAQTEGSERHPLCAVVRTDLLADVSAALDRGERGVGDLWSELGGSPVCFDDPEAFINLNSPGDLNAWLAGRSNDARR
jgi:molybdopterin-guanine dinucleotide biosynthesis protein A